MLTKYKKIQISGAIAVACLLAVLLALPVRASSSALAAELFVTNGLDENDDVALSGDGSTAAFVTSQALVGADTNSKNDVYVYDVATEEFELASVTSAEALSTDGNSTYLGLSLSFDGQYIGFTSNVTDLVAGDTNGVRDAFVRDRTAGTTERVSLDSSEGELNANAADPSITNDGRYVVFWTSATDAVAGDTNGFIDAFMRDRTAGTTERVSVTSSEAQLTGGSSWVEGASISGDGRYIAFMSYATNAVAGDTNGDGDVFLRDTVDGTTVRISVDEDGNQVAQFSEGGNINNEGTYITFRSLGQLVAADDQAFVDVYRYRISDGDIQLVSANSSGVVGDEDSDGGQSNEMPVSSDGRFVLFDSDATNLVSGYTRPAGITVLYLKDMQSGEVKVVNDVIDQDLYGMSDDGSRVLFHNGAPAGELILGLTSEGDSDDDGIPNGEEATAPNEGDANDDGVLDALQANVANYVNPITGEYVTLEASDDCQINSVESAAEDDNNVQDAGFDYPSGLMSFTLDCGTPAYTATVRQLYHGIEFESFEVRKYNSVSETYQAISDAAVQGTTIGDSLDYVQAQYDITDGGELDEDGTADGVIVDPTGLALGLAAPATGLGGAAN